MLQQRGAVAREIHGWPTAAPGAVDGLLRA